MVFCEHLDAYGVQYVKTEAAYEQCNNLVAQIQNNGASKGLIDLLQKALQEWKSDNSRLRKEFCALVEEQKIVLPLLPQTRPKCAECGLEVPKLEYKEWKIASNGVAALNGEELMAPQLV